MQAISIVRTALAAMLLGAGHAAWARPLTWDCDTGEGNFSLLQTTQEGPAYRISGRVSAVVLRDDPRWVPSATVWIDAAGDDWVAIRISRTRPNQLEVRLSWRTGGQVQERSFATLAPATEVPFELRLSPAGEATARFGEAQATTRFLPRPNGTVALTCSTGEFLFENVEF